MKHNYILKQWLAPVLLSIICIALYALQSTMLPVLEFSRHAIADNQWWRLLSGNLMHTNHWHLLLNIAGLCLLTHLFCRLYQWQHFIVFSLINATFVGCLLLWFSPDISYYVGLSGYLHGLFVYGCLLEISKGMKSSWLLLAGVCCKIGYENFYGASAQMSDLINASVATDAHLYGALIALPQFALLFIYQLLIKPKKQP